MHPNVQKAIADNFNSAEQILIGVPASVLMDVFRTDKIEDLVVYLASALLVSLKEENRFTPEEVADLICALRNRKEAEILELPKKSEY